MEDITEISRETAIIKLIDNAMDCIFTGNMQGDNSYLNDILNSGHKGYEEYTNEELEKELNEVFIDMEKFKIIS